MIGGTVSSVTRSYTSGTCSEYNYVIAGTGASYTCCTTDGCNGSIIISNSLILIIVLSGVTHLMKIIG